MPYRPLARPCCSAGNVSLRMDCSVGPRTPCPTLQHAGHGERGQRRRHGREDRCSGKRDQPDLIDTLASPHGPEPSGERQYDDQGDEVRGRDPGRLRHGDPKGGLDIGQGHIDDRPVDGPHQRADGDRRGDEPLARRHWRAGSDPGIGRHHSHQCVPASAAPPGAPPSVVSMVASTESPI